MPWYVQEKSALLDSETTILRFDMKILIYLFLGALCEFVGCQIFMISFNYAQQANINDGIPSSLILFSSVFILTCCYFLYKERINLLQGIGLAVILVGVIVISIFKAAP